MDDRKMTKQELWNLMEELDALISTERPLAAERLKIARADGDLAENAAYAEALAARNAVESRIVELQEILDAQMDDNGE